MKPRSLLYRQTETARRFHQDAYTRMAKAVDAVPCTCPDTPGPASPDCRHCELELAWTQAERAATRFDRLRERERVRELLVRKGEDSAAETVARMRWPR